MACTFVTNKARSLNSLLTKGIIDENLNIIQTPIKEGVNSIFEENTELSNIGSQEQYSQYLDTIFPNSKLKNINYHGTEYPQKFEKFDSRLSGTQTKEDLITKGFWFTYQKEVAEDFGSNVLSVLLNIQNTYRAETKITKSFPYIKTFPDQVESVNKAIKEGYDSAFIDVLENLESGQGTTELVVFEPEQIHILGSKIDIEGFKRFVKNNPNINNESRFYNENIKVTKQMEEVIGSKIPNDVFAFGLNENFVTPNIELFYRADAAEDIIYPENQEFKDNYNYPVTTNENTVDLNTKLTDLLKNIGVSVENLTTNHKYKSVAGVADTFHKVAYTSINKAGIDTLPEEASHMFVDFIEQNEPALFNKMLADIPKYDIYKSVKEEYLPIYQDINKVKKEAIGKAISEYLVGNGITPRVDELRTWFDKVLDAVRKALANFGIITTADYNNYFEITADKILAGGFVGDFEGNQVYFNTETGETTGPLERIDRIDAQLELRPTPEGKDAYFFNGKQVKKRVSEKIRDKSIPITESSSDQLKAIESGKAGHHDLMNLWKIKLGEKLPENVQVMTNPNTVYPKLRTFVDILYNQFPGAKWRTEVKVYNPKGDLAGTIDLIAEETDGTINIFDYKFMEGKISAKSKEQYTKQLGEYRTILKDAYGVKKFGQIRLLPFRTSYTGKLESKTLTDIDFGNNALQPVAERDHLNPIPASFELTKNEKINQAIRSLQDELLKVQELNVKGAVESQAKKSRILAIEEAVARLQISQDLTSLEDIALVDKERMQYILNKQNPTTNELIDLKELRDYYKDFISKRYNIDKDGNENIALTEIAVLAQTQSEDIDKKLEEFYNTQDVNINEAQKPISKNWSRYTQLSDYDNPVFKAFYKLINRGYSQNEIKVKKEYQDIKDIINQIRQETGKSGVDMYDNILQKDSKGKPTNRLISKNSKEWYEMHKSVFSDPKLKSTLNQYFDKAKWKEYFDPIVKDRMEQLKTLDDDAKSKKIAEFTSFFERKYGIGNSNSSYFTVPDKFLNPEYLKYVKNAPESGLAKLYNKYIEINKYAREHSDVDVPLTLLPYVRKSTIEMLMNDGFNFKNLTNNALDKLKSYDWETTKLDANGQKINTIPLRFKGTEYNLQEDQSHDLGEMLMLWTESVYQNAYLNETHATAQLLELALKKSKQVVLDSAGKPVVENGELRTAEVNKETVQSYREYVNKYFYGVTNEDEDFAIGPYSGQKVVKTALKYLSGNAIGLNVFSGLADITGGFTQALSIGAKGNQFTNTQLRKSITNLHDPKMRSLISLLDVTNNEFQKDKAINLSANKAESFVTWDKLYILQQGGDWLLQNSVLGAMGQNYTIAEGKIIKKTNKEQKSLIESLQFDKNGKVIIEGLDLNQEKDYLELLKFRDKVRRVGAEVTGNTSESDKQLAGNTLTSQLLLQFRRWILPMANSRFGDLKHNVNLEEYQIGKYRSTFQGLVNKRITTVLGEYIKDQKSATFDDILIEKWNEAKVLNPNIEFEEFRNLYIQNLRSVATELILIGLLAGLKVWMDDDEDQNIGQKVLSRALTRTSSELTFWFNPSSFLSILRTPVPAVNLLGDLSSLMSNTGKNAVNMFFDGDTDTNAGERFMKLIPGASAYMRLVKELEED